MKKKAMILLDKEKHIMTLLADCQMNKWRYCVVVVLMWNQKLWSRQAKTRGIRAFCLNHINNSFSILSRPIFSYRNREGNSAVLSPSLLTTLNCSMKQQPELFILEVELTSSHRRLEVWSGCWGHCSHCFWYAGITLASSSALLAQQFHE